MTFFVINFILHCFYGLLWGIVARTMYEIISIDEEIDKNKSRLPLGPYIRIFFFGFFMGMTLYFWQKDLWGW